MDQKLLNLAIVGCGNIAESYGKSLQAYPQLNLLGATSRTFKHAENFVATFGSKVYPYMNRPALKHPLTQVCSYRFFFTSSSFIIERAKALHYRECFVHGNLGPT